MLKNLLVFCLFFIIFCAKTKAQCTSPDSLKLTIHVKTDSFPSETGWTLFSIAGKYYDIKPKGFFTDYFKTYTFNYCIPKDECMKFTLIDKDGIAYPGGVSIVVKQDTVAKVTFADNVDVNYFNCKAGETCGTPKNIVEGAYTTTYKNNYYSFSPTKDGFYKLSTCDAANTCDTKIWVYEECRTFNPLDTKLGTVAFNDSSKTCGKLAELPQMIMDKTRSYTIRIGGDNCSAGVKWQLSYISPVKGCRDSTACNYNYLATEDGDACVPQNTNNCTGPDLVISSEAIINSLAWGKENADWNPCLVNEGCLKGFGWRNVLKFDSQISNIGDQDYYIGKVTANPTQFVWDACHQHYHYKGYAEYLLFNDKNEKIPIGFKAGFCVTDFECLSTSAMKYSCLNMGLSVGCTDIYERNLACQWVDMTDVPAGKYTLVARVNWDNSPDRLGRMETRNDNNWAQVCLELKRQKDSVWYVLDTTNCPIWKDCKGIAYGNATVDCEGSCGGKALGGDINKSQKVDNQDIVAYTQSALSENETPTTCNDLNADGRISVTDASLLASCIAFGKKHIHAGAGDTHDHCQFPVKANNQQDTVKFSIQNYNPIGKYFDIAIHNISKEVNAYQLKLSNVQITKVRNLIDSTKYPAKVFATLNKGIVLGISYEDSVIVKNATKKALLRVHFSNNATTNVCIDAVTDVTDRNGYSLVGKIEGQCQKISSDKTPILMNLNPVIYPHPIENTSVLEFYNPENQSFMLEIYDINGRLVHKSEPHSDSQFTIEKDKLGVGFFLYKIRGENGFAAGKIIVE
jgi:Lysyl oxidase/Secretion system C-terminal sorting domain/Dockerin type I domain